MNVIDTFGMQGQSVPGRGKTKCKGLNRRKELGKFEEHKVGQGARGRAIGSMVRQEDRTL